MKSKLAYLTVAKIALGLSAVATLHGQTIGIRVNGNVHVDVDTIPTEQFWVTESPNLIDWAKHTFVEHSTSIDCGPPASDRRFYRLEPLYGPITWSQLPDMPVARDQFTGGVIDGKLYVFGGNGNPDGNNLSRMDICDLSTGQWTRGEDYDLGREELSSAVVGGKLYVFGGYPSPVNLCYDPVTDFWSETANKPTWVQATTAVAWGDEILVLGGSRGESLPAVSVIEAYNTLSNTWRHVGNLQGPNFVFGASIHEDVLYLIGGIDHDSLAVYNKVQRLDLSSETWLPDLDGLLPYPVLAMYSSACPVVNAKMIIGGGITTRDGTFDVTGFDDFVVTDLVTVYDIRTNTFSNNTILPELFDDHLFVLSGDKLLALGGKIGPGFDAARSSRLYTGTFNE